MVDLGTAAGVVVVLEGSRTVELGASVAVGVIGLLFVNIYYESLVVA